MPTAAAAVVVAEFAFHLNVDCCFDVDVGSFVCWWWCGYGCVAAVVVKVNERM